MRFPLRQLIKKYEIAIAVLVGSACLTVGLLNLDFYFLEANLYDLRMTLGFQSAPSTSIVLITIDDKTMKELEELPPLSFDVHSRLLKTLEAQSPKAIGYLVEMNQIHHINRGLSRSFVRTIEKMESQGTPFLLGTPFELSGEVLPSSPLNTLSHAVAVVHKDGNVFSEDKITRRALLTLYGRPTFHLELARKAGFLGKEELPKEAFDVPEVDGKYFFFRYHGNPSGNPSVSNSAAYPTYSLIDVIQHRVPLTQFKDKIILVGTMLSEQPSDFAFTPYSNEVLSNPTLLIHANILDSLIQRDGIVRAPKILNWLVTFIATTSVLWWIATSTPLYGVFATLALAFGFIVISQILFQWQGLWLRESQPLVGIFVGYYLAVPYRLIREYKKRWDYQKKNELLTQVEELKTNFLNLVTHDLKTPVARIQGLAEVVLRNSDEPDSKNNQDKIRTIIASTEELNRFISSILELSQVESNRIHLQAESKDINRLIENSIQNFSAQAHIRGIQIEAQLEPLFSIKIDASLISKVINNLIDNSIKYSFPNSKVIVKSYEEDQWVVISVRDEGIGMTPDETENLFTRFYRAKNDATSTISGTGLGLYLTRYFVEAHQGCVKVESEIGKGSTFSIYLPMNAGTVLPSQLTMTNSLKEIKDVQNSSR